MLSEQFNVSNESMFRVRGEIKMATAGQPVNVTSGVSASGFGGFGGGAGDSTYRGCDDSVYGYDDDKGLISESDDGGWYTNTGEKDNAVATGAAENKFDDISEHTSDEITDSDQEDNPAEGESPKKTKKKTEKCGEKKKKKKKKAVAEA